MARRVASIGDSFVPGQVWESPRGTFYKVMGYIAVEPGQRREVLLRQGIHGLGRKQTRWWDAVQNWVLHRDKDEAPGEPPGLPPEPILVYRFHEAPQQLQDLSTNGGDEDWIAVIPPALAETHISWMESTGFDTSTEYQEYPCPDKPGYLVRIGSHA